MRTPIQFYNELGVSGLANLKNSKRDKLEFDYILRIINKKQKILDLACGYGRVTIPLAKKGYDVKGLDLTPRYITEAKKSAKKQKLKIEFKVGDMRKTPYQENSFDVILCLWTAFNEIIKKSDQIKAIKEMYRILKPDGFVFMDLPCHLNKKDLKKLGLGDKYIFKKNISYTWFNSIESTPEYRHTKKSLKTLMKLCKIKKYKIKIGRFGDRKRLLFQFWKT
jgi:ubiquinone/menaquinone biosynthesis C-methylase UbiE